MIILAIVFFCTTVYFWNDRNRRANFGNLVVNEFIKRNLLTFEIEQSLVKIAKEQKIPIRPSYLWRMD